MSTTTGTFPTDPPGRRARQKAETRARILEAARELFVRNGVEATTMRAIASRIDCTPTAIYHHFRNKDSLIQELCSADLRELEGALAQIAELPDPLERIQRMGLAWIGFSLTNAQQYRFIFDTPMQHHDPLSADRAHVSPGKTAYLLLVASVEEGLKRGLFRAEFQDAHQLTQILWGGVHGLIALHMAPRDAPWIEWADPRATARLAIDVMLRGTRRAEPA